MALYNLANEFEVEKLKADVSRDIENNRIVEYIRKNDVRTLKQNSYLHLLIGLFAVNYGISIDEAKIDFFKRECNRDLFEVEHTNSKGKQVLRLRSSRDLDTKEMTLAIERFRNWSSSVAEIYLPSANEREFLIYAQQEIDRNKQFL